MFLIILLFQIDWFSLSFFIIFIIFFVLIVYFNIYSIKKRKEEIQQFAQKNGFTMESKNEILNLLNGRIISTIFGIEEVILNTDIDFFNLGHSKSIENIFSVPYKDSKIYFFDYRYKTGTGRNSHTYFYNVALFLTSQKIPSFVLRPENFLDKIPEFFGKNDIDFQHRPKFSKNYYLEGKNVQEIKNFFNDDLIGFFESNPNPDFAIESYSEKCILIYKRYLSNQHYLNFIHDTKLILDHLF